MISIITNKPFYYNALAEVLKAFDPQDTISPDQEPDLCIIYSEQAQVDVFLKEPVSYPVILIGTHHEEADLELPAPCLLSELIQHIERLLVKTQNAVQFENKRFIFDGAHRILQDKKAEKEYKLTEKETALLTYLVKSFPEGVSKTDLLTDVWQYNPEVETHTLESHIYTLRQKITETAAEELINNITDGYILVE